MSVFNLEMISSPSGYCIGLNNYRIAGKKPWGGGKVLKEWKISLEDLINAIPELKAKDKALEEAVEAIQDAPHAEDCEGRPGQPDILESPPHPCNCWKATAEARIAQHLGGEVG